MKNSKSENIENIKEGKLKNQIKSEAYKFYDFLRKNWHVNCFINRSHSKD